jgi:hypothetical protein
MGTHISSDVHMIPVLDSQTAVAPASMEALFSRMIYYDAYIVVILGRTTRRDDEQCQGEPNDQ